MHEHVCYHGDVEITSSDSIVIPCSASLVLYTLTNNNIEPTRTIPQKYLVVLTFVCLLKSITNSVECQRTIFVSASEYSFMYRLGNLVGGLIIHDVVHTDSTLQSRCLRMT